MPQKRHHKKSRYGCDQCRKRRVKCDEKRPCGHCAARDEDCHFSRSIFLSPNIFSTDTSTSAASSPGMDTSSAAISPRALTPRRDTNESSTQEPFDRTKELTLMHQWCTRTCYSFSTGLGDMFREHVGGIALQHEFLLDAMFGLTSLQMACETDDAAKVRTYVGDALQYQNDAIAGLREALNSISPTNCDAVFVSTLVMMASAIVSPLLPAGPEDEPASTSEVVLGLIEYLNATRVIAGIARTWLMETPVRALFEMHKPGSGTGTVWSPAERLVALNDALVPWGSAEHLLFANTIESLGTAFTEKHSYLVWLVQCQPEFMDGVRGEHPVALAIFMNWGVMLHQLGDSWWAKYSGAKLVDDLSMTLSTQSPDLNRMALWCREQVGL